MSFDPKAALASAHDRLIGRHTEVVERATGEMDAAMEAAREYAKHLASGGDPTEYPDARYDRHNSALVSPVLGIQIVFNAWNAGRGSTNPVSPIRNVKAWKVAEYMHDHIGETVTFATLAEVYQVPYASGGRSKKGTPDEIATAMLAAQTDTLIARKTKLDGKVAYILREKGEGEERAQHTWSFPVEGAAVAAGG